MNSGRYLCSLSRYLYSIYFNVSVLQYSYIYSYDTFALSLGIGNDNLGQCFCGVGTEAFCHT